MSTETKFIYHCDRCKKECLPVKRIHWCVPNTESKDVSSERIYIDINYFIPYGNPDADICAECLKEITGIVIK